MADQKGIKETLELLQGVKDLVVDFKKVFADGKVNIEDLPVAMELLGQMGELTAAAQGVNDVWPELKDLSGDEIDQVVAKALEVVAAFKAA